MAAVLDDLKAQAEEMRDKALAPINLAQELGGGSLPSLKDKPHRPGTKALSADRPPFKPRWLAQLREEATKKSSGGASGQIEEGDVAIAEKRGKMALMLGSPAKSRAQPSQQQAAAQQGRCDLRRRGVRAGRRRGSEQPMTHIQFDHQYTYGLSNFDDEFSYTLMHVDQEARLKPALFVQHGIHNLSVRDVKRADLLASIEPPAPRSSSPRRWSCAPSTSGSRSSRSKTARARRATTSRRRRARRSILVEELEKLAHVLEQLGNRTQRMVSNPELYRERSSILGGRRPRRRPRRPAAGGSRRRRSCRTRSASAG